MKTHHLIRPFSLLSVLALLTALVAAPVPAHAEETLLGADASLSYLDDGSDPAADSDERTAWASADFDDSEWKSASGPFGAKNGELADLGGGRTPKTLLEQYEPGTQTNHPAFFFRTTFDLSAEQANAAIKGLADYDDALTVYVNGDRVAGFDDESIEGNLDFGGSNASAPKSAEFTAGPESLVEGENTIAFELHQGRESSSDIYFGLESLTTAEVSEESAITDSVLQVGDDETSRNVSWMSASSGGGEVRWAKASELEGQSLPADSQSAETTKSGLSTDLKRHYNHASMTGLEPDTEYAYQVGSDEDGFSTVSTFDTGKSGGDSEFLVFGDPQIGSGGGQPDDATGWDRTLNSALATAEDPRFFYSMGDQVNSANDQSQYKQYLAPEATTTVAQATTIGNHDVASKSYEQHFNRPNVSEDHGGGSAITSGSDYWFIDSGVLFININSNNLDTDAHAEFIDDVVAEHGEDARWKVLGFHHSIYSTATHNDDSDVKKLREAIPPVAARNDIDLVVSGHDHIYNRTFLMDSEGKPVEGSDAGLEQEKDEGQTMYLTLTSSSGSKFYQYVPGLEWEAKSVHNDVPAFTRVRVSDGSLRATTYEVPTGSDGQVTAQAASEEIDDVEITRTDDEAPEPGDDAEADADSGEAEAEADADADGAEADADSGEAEADAASAGASATASANGGGDLPRTGSQIGLPVALGAGAIIVGALLLAVTRRGRNTLS